MDFTFYDSVINRSILLEGVYRSKNEQLNKSRDEIKGLNSEMLLLEKTEKLLKFLADKAAKKDLVKMDSLVTYGVNKVFHDRNIKFLSEIVEYGKKLRIVLKTLEHGDKEVSTDTVGSVTVVESLLLRLLCIAKLKKAKLLLMDETFGSIDSAYIYNVSNLISELSKRLGIDILLVTHNPGFEEAVTNSFRLKLINNNVEIEKLK